MSQALHARTPTLAVRDSRGLLVRTTGWYRAAEDQPEQERVERSAFNGARRKVFQWDARLFADAQAPANLSVVYSLSGQVLARDSVDSGMQVRLLGEAGQLLESWDGRQTHGRREYDELLRPVAVFEHGAANGETCVERLDYASADASAGNQCGQLIRHDDPAGTLLNAAFGLTGVLIEQTRHFLVELSLPDWPQVLHQRDTLLESGNGATTFWRFNPLGEVLEQTDAMGNTQSFEQTVAGQLSTCCLQLKDQPPRTLVSDIRYDAHKRIESETLGNGVTTTSQFDPANGRLLHLRARRNDGDYLQDLRYDHDAVGNVVSIEDLAQPTRFFANQQIEPVREFAYDTLYQLIKATGYEAATLNRGPIGSGYRSFATANELANYTQHYEYDAGGNLQMLTHVGAQSRTRTFVTARHSNRSLLHTGDQPPSEAVIAAGFDECGNLRELQAGQSLSWDLRNQVCEVHPVERETGDDDREVYRYDAQGQRVRKARTTLAQRVVHVQEVRYLPGLEVRTNTATGEVLHVISASTASSPARVLHWLDGKPPDIANDQLRHSLTDHMGSSTLELDAQAQLISQEIYYPYGETAWSEARSEIEAKYKTVRYSGKERDTTGLYYYGLRYYAPWLMRWINPDPAEEVDGLNLFCFVRNNPVGLRDMKGAAAFPVDRISDDDVRAASLNEDYALAQAVARERGSSEDSEVIDTWLESLIGDANLTEMAPFDSRMNNSLFQVDSQVPGIKWMVKRMQWAGGPQREEMAYRVSHALGLHVVPPTRAKKTSSIQQMIGSARKNTGSDAVRLSEPAKLFYFLINEMDDNSGNQLLDSKGNLYLIDHEAAFTANSNSVYNVSTIDLMQAFTDVSWERFKQFKSRDWKSMMSRENSTFTAEETGAFVQRINDTKRSVQSMIDRGEVSFGQKRSFLQTLARKKVA